MQINYAGNYLLLIKAGSATEEQCKEKWEEILKVNGEVSGNLQFIQIFTDVQTYALLYQEYLFLKACLALLSIKVDKEVAQMLIDEGYNIELNGSSTDYEKSLVSCHRQADNLTNQIKIKEGEIKRQREKDGKSTKQRGSGFEEAIANISHLLGFSVGDDVTLARYNEYCKIVKKKYERKNRETAYNQ